MAGQISLTVRVEGADGIRNVDILSGYSDPYVILRLKDQERRTKKQDNTQSPKWQEAFVFRCTKTDDLKLECEIFDASPTGDTSLGSFVVPAGSLLGGPPNVESTCWYPLTGHLAQGRTQLTIKWCDVDAQSGSQLAGSAGLGPGAEKPTPQPLKELEKKREEEEEAKKKDLKSIKVKPGDYQVLVHIIEAIDLAPRDENNSLDPVVSVEVMGQEDHTRIQSPCTSCFIDHHMIFQLPKMSVEQLREASVKFVAKDADYMGDDLIGSCEIQLMQCYYQPNHELWRRSLCLVDERNPGRGPQGFLRISLTVLGPDDVEPDHSMALGVLEAEREENDSIFFPPSVQQGLQFLVVGLHRAEHLPAMDSALGVHQKTDSFFEVRFPGARPVTSSIQTVKGSSLAPKFDEELWIPVPMPIGGAKLICDTITIIAWDYDNFSSSDRIATLRLNLWDDVQSPKTRKTGKRWYNLYGPPTMVEDAEEGKKMTLFPELGSTYCGRVLLSLRMETSTQENEARKVRPVVQSRDVRENLPIRKVVLRAMLLGAAYLPGDDPVFFRVCIGPHEFVFPEVKATYGHLGLESKAYVESPTPLELPLDLEQAPDVFIYLSKRATKSQRILQTMAGSATSKAVNLCYTRIPAKDLLAVGFKDPRPAPRWFPLVGDAAAAEIDILNGDCPGSVLMALGMGACEEAQRAPWQLQYGPSLLGEMKTFEVRLHLHRARNLPSGEKVVARDPYIKVLCWGVPEIKPGWSRRTNTCHPEWYETISFQADLPTLHALPSIVVQVWDAASYYLLSDSYIGCATIPLTEAFYRATGDLSNPPEAKPYPIHVHGLDDGQGGDLLASVELCSLPVRTPMQSIKPPRRKYAIEIFALGLRGLQSHLVPSGSPYMLFEIGDNGGQKSTDIAKTRSSCRPISVAPNFLDKVVLEVEFPDIQYVERNLHFRVLDARYGGSVDSLLGTGVIPLNGNDNAGTGAAASGTTRSASPMDSENPNTEVSMSGLANSALKLARKGIDQWGANSAAEAIPAFEFMEGRRTLNTGLEPLLEATAPFRIFPIARGASTSGFGRRRGHSSKAARIEGWFKGCVALRPQGGQASSPALALEEFLSPVEVVVRLYILRGLTLRTGTSYDVDPYLLVKLGDRVISQKSLATDGSNFHQFFEFPTVLPGAARLEVEVWSRGLVKDRLIGTTTIDVEDRWFNEEWKKMAKDQPMPVERRSLWSPTHKREQGKLECWVDIISAGEAKYKPPINVSPPPPEEYEVRVVIWKLNAASAEVQDLFVKCQLGDGRAQATDTHWQARRGRGSFNYRCVFPVELAWQELDTETVKTKLRLQVFDAKMVMLEKCLSERTIDLRKHFLYARSKQYRGGPLDLGCSRTINAGHGLSASAARPKAKSPYEQDGGNLCVSIQIVTKEFADTFPVGLGQGAPNQLPYLPSPPGRHSWLSFMNPCFVLDELDCCCGSTHIAMLCCSPCLLFLLILVLIRFFEAIDELNDTEDGLGTAVLVLVLVGLCASCCLWCCWLDHPAAKLRTREADLIRKLKGSLGLDRDPENSLWISTTYPNYGPNTVGKKVLPPPSRTPIVPQVSMHKQAQLGHGKPQREEAKPEARQSLLEPPSGHESSADVAEQEDVPNIQATGTATPSPRQGSLFSPSPIPALSLRHHPPYFQQQQQQQQQHQRLLSHGHQHNRQLGQPLEQIEEQEEISTITAQQEQGTPQSEPQPMQPPPLTSQPFQPLQQQGQRQSLRPQWQLQQPLSPPPSEHQYEYSPALMTVQEPVSTRAYQPQPQTWQVVDEPMQRQQRLQHQQEDQQHFAERQHRNDLQQLHPPPQQQFEQQHRHQSQPSQFAHSSSPQFSFPRIVEEPVSGVYRGGNGNSSSSRLQPPLRSRLGGLSSNAGFKDARQSVSGRPAPAPGSGVGPLTE